VEGQDLDRLLTRARTDLLPTAVALFIMRELLEGLHHAHGMKDERGAVVGLVHRDLAPRNILLGFDGGVKVADFGASVFALTELAAPEVIGSAGYLSPEQARMEMLDGRSDVFAAGCILYQMVTGVPAFNIAGRTDARILAMHQAGAIQPVPATVPSEIRLIIEIACAADAEDRYKDAAAMRDDVDRVRRELGSLAGKDALAAVMGKFFGGERADVRA